MDLLGRKVAGDGGKTLFRFVGQMRDTATEAARHVGLVEPAQRLLDCLDRLSTSTQALLDCKEPALRLANATIYLDAFGHVVIGWIWLWQATLAAEALAWPETSTEEHTFYEGKLLACLHFSRHQLPLAMARISTCAGRLTPPASKPQPAPSALTKGAVRPHRGPPSSQAPGRPRPSPEDRSLICFRNRPRSPAVQRIPF